jgi:hypothetical protein
MALRPQSKTLAQSNTAPISARLYRGTLREMACGFGRFIGWAFLETT